MVDCGDNEVTHWSYYDEYLKSKKIRARRKQFSELDDVVALQIKSGRISKAVDIREKLKKVAEVGGVVLDSFINGNNTLSQCYRRAVTRGATSKLYNRLLRFRKHLSDINTKKDLKKMKRSLKNKCKHELNRIRKRIDAFLEIIEREDE